MKHSNILSEISVSYSCIIPKSKRQKIRSSRDCYRIFNSYWNHDLIELQEEMNVMILNRSNDVLGIFNSSKGSSSGTIVDVKLIYGIALKCNASSIIICHNHPSGNLNPSSADLDITQKLKKAGELLELPMLDHLIISKDGYFSFADEGKL